MSGWRMSRALSSCWCVEVWVGLKWIASAFRIAVARCCVSLRYLPELVVLFCVVVKTLKP
jgi:hypothetical protein